MKKLILIVVAVLAAVQLYSQDRVSLIREKLLNRDQSTVIVASHRGDWRNYPENSLEAIDNAIKMGVDIVELDVQRTKDGQLILMHDPTLDRTSTGKGKIAVKPDMIRLYVNKEDLCQEYEETKELRRNQPLLFL